MWHFGKQLENVAIGIMKTALCHAKLLFMNICCWFWWRGKVILNLSIHPSNSAWTATYYMLCTLLCPGTTMYMKIPVICRDSVQQLQTQTAELYQLTTGVNGYHARGTWGCAQKQCFSGRNKRGGIFPKRGNYQMSSYSWDKDYRMIWKQEFRMKTKDVFRADIQSWACLSMI